MRLIDGEWLEKNLANLYESMGWDESDVHFSLRDMRANIKTETEIRTIYGYKIDELVFIADALKKAGKSSHELEDLIDDTKTIVQTVLQIIRDEREEAFRKAVSGDG